MVLSSTMPPFHACERNWLTSIILVATWQDPQIMVYCNLYIYIYIIYICVCMWYFIPNPHRKQLKERAPHPTLSGFSAKKSGYILTPPAIISLTSIQSQNPNETHVFCCYPRNEWSLNLQQQWFRGVMTGWHLVALQQPACAFFFFVFWCNKRNFSDQVHKSVVGSNNWCVPSAMLKFWYSTVELLQTNQNLWHGINGPTQSSTVLK